MFERPDVLIALGHELERAASRSLSARRRSYGSAALILGGLVTALAVAAVVLVLPMRRTAGVGPAAAPDGFAVLSRARTPADLLTAAAFETTSNLPPDHVLDADQSRLVLSRPGELAWVVPAGSELCLVVQSSSGARDSVFGECATRAWAAQHGLPIADLERIVLVLPTRIRAVDVGTANGQTRTAAPNQDGVVTASGDSKVLIAGQPGMSTRARLLYPSPAQTAFSGGLTPDGRLTAHARLTPRATSSAMTGEVRAYQTTRLRLLRIDLRNTPQAGGPPWYAVWLHAPDRAPTLLGFLRAGHTRGGELDDVRRLHDPRGNPNRRLSHARRHEHHQAPRNHDAHRHDHAAEVRPALGAKYFPVLANRATAVFTSACARFEPAAGVRRLADRQRPRRRWSQASFV